MNPRRIRAMAVKESLQIWRDPRSLLLVLLTPFMQMMMMGYGVSLDIKHVPTCVRDQEGSQKSQDLLKRFQASAYFDIVAVLPDQASLARAVDGGTCQLVIVLPYDFSLRLNDRGTAAVQAVIDGTDNNTATVAATYAQSVVSAYGAEVRQVAGQRRPARPPPAGIALQPRVWFNEDLNSRNFIIPGVVAIVMALVGCQLIALTISREWERGTMEQLISTPVTGMEVMIGKLLPYFAVGMFDAAFCLGLAVFWFEVPFRGGLATLTATTALFLLVVLGIGYLVSVLVKSQLNASLIALLLSFLPTVLLSGFLFPIDQMGPVLRTVTTIVYSRYYVTILKAVFLKGAGIADLALPTAALALYAAVVIWAAARAFKKRLD